MEMIPTYIARKWGQEKVEYDHPLMEPILRETYGVMVYQEQIMQIASQLAGYTLGEGDVLRKAMGKKDAKEMAKQRAKFIEGAISRGLTESSASSIFDKMEKFAEYGFNKSHSAAYGYLTYATAYFKAHFPSEWLAALMTGDKDDVEKVAKTMHEALDMGIACLPPDINESNENFTATAKGIRFALNAIKGVGASAVEAIIEERNKKPFDSLYDVINRIDAKRLGKKMIELLIEAGALDQFGWTRDELLSSLEVMFDDIQRAKKERSQGILSLFDQAHEKAPKRYLDATKPSKARSQEEILFKEKQLLGLFVSGHPLTFYQETLSSLACLTIKTAKTVPDGTTFRMAFVVETVDLKVASKTQRKFAILSVSDASGETLEVPIWPDLFDENHDILLENNLLWGVFTKEKRDGQGIISCKWISDLRTINQAEIDRSYTAYEKAKAQFSSSRSLQSKKSKLPQEPDLIKKTPVTKVRIDLTKLRASHIIALAQGMHVEGGSDCVHMSLEKDGREQALLKLPPVHFEQGLKGVFKTLPSWIEC
jgi:DNA polymerase III subunit alpha